MTVDGLSPAPGGDLRGKMTYVPSGRKIEGWAQPADRNNSFTAIYFDPAILSEETERMFSTGDFVPSVYFRDDNIRNTLERLEIALRSDNDNHVFVETLGLLPQLAVEILGNPGVENAVLAAVSGHGGTSVVTQHRRECNTNVLRVNRGVILCVTEPA